MCFLLFWQGEQGERGEMGYPGDPGLPGPQVAKSTLDLIYVSSGEISCQS